MNVCRIICFEKTDVFTQCTCSHHRFNTQTQGLNQELNLIEETVADEMLQSLLLIPLPFYFCLTSTKFYNSRGSTRFDQIFPNTVLKESYASFITSSNYKIGYDTQIFIKVYKMQSKI
jgi:hypothetical protein